MTKVVKVVDWLSTQADASFDFSTFLEGWFLGTPTSELRRDNVVQFLAWAMYAKEVENMSKSERKNVSDGVCKRFLPSGCAFYFTFGGG